MASQELKSSRNKILVDCRYMPHVAVRVFVGYAQAQRMASSWAQVSEKTAVYEHLGEKTAKVHCHFALYGCRVSTERLKQLARELGHSFKGNKDWSFKTWDGDESYITYMTKGNLEPKYFSGYSVEELTALRSKWVEKRKAGASDKDSLTFDRFMDYLDAKDTPCFVKFKDLKAAAVSWAFEECGRIWSVNTAKMAKMLAMTYAMREGLAFEDVDMTMKMF